MTVTVYLKNGTIIPNIKCDKIRDGCDQVALQLWKDKSVVASFDLDAVAGWYMAILKG